jgi:hypothetical protein
MTGGVKVVTRGQRTPGRAGAAYLLTDPGPFMNAEISIAAGFPMIAKGSLRFLI